MNSTLRSKLKVEYVTDITWSSLPCALISSPLSCVCPEDLCVSSPLCTKAHLITAYNQQRDGEGCTISNSQLKYVLVKKREREKWLSEKSIRW